MTKFYLNLKDFIGFYNTFVLFGAMGFGSLVYFYYDLPETENKTLKEIAEHFNQKSKTGPSEKPSNDPNETDNNKMDKEILEQFKLEPGAKYSEIMPCNTKRSLKDMADELNLKLEPV